jgi:peptidoglycan/LPS O-acetylase OafA/YrhL
MWLAPTKPSEAAGLLVPSPPLWIYGTFLQNFYFAGTGASGTPWLSATWSLAVEEQFYLCLPLVVFLAPPTRLAPLLMGLIAAAPLFRILLYDLPPVPGFADYVLMPGRADALLIGVLGAWLVRHEPARQWLNVHQGWLRLALLVLLAGVVVLHQSYLGYIAFPMMAVGYTWLALFYGCLILVAVTATRGVVRAITRLPPLRYLGNISYALYLIHVPVSKLIYDAWNGQSDKVHSGSDALVMVLALLAPIVMAALSWHLMERPLMRLGHSQRYRFDV